MPNSQVSASLTSIFCPLDTPSVREVQWRLRQPTLTTASRLDQVSIQLKTSTVTLMLSAVPGRYALLPVARWGNETGHDSQSRERQRYDVRRQLSFPKHTGLLFITLPRLICVIHTSILLKGCRKLRTWKVGLKHSASSDRMMNIWTQMSDGSKSLYLVWITQCSWMHHVPAIQAPCSLGWFSSLQVFYGLQWRVGYS